MRKGIMGIDEAKRSIAALMGHRLSICVNRGRKKIEVYDGTIGGVYPSVFTLQIIGDKNLSMLSCSYCDFICGDVALKKTPQ